MQVTASASRAVCAGRVQGRLRRPSIKLWSPLSPYAVCYFLISLVPTVRYMEETREGIARRSDMRHCCAASLQCRVRPANAPAVWYCVRPVLDDGECQDVQEVPGRNVRWTIALFYNYFSPSRLCV